MRFTLSALAAVLQLSSLPSSDAFSPATLSSVAKTASPPVRKNDILYAQLNDDDGEDNKSGLASILLAGAAFQFSTTKVSATLTSSSCETMK